MQSTRFIKNLYIVTCQLLYHYLFRMTFCITSRRGTSKLLELVPNPFDDINKICSKHIQCASLLLPSVDGCLH